MNKGERAWVVKKAHRANPKIYPYKKGDKEIIKAERNIVLILQPKTIWTEKGIQEERTGKKKGDQEKRRREWKMTEKQEVV